jgi:hypothetical protein
MQIYSNNHLQLTALEIALAVMFFTEIDSLNKIPPIFPHPNFVIYASIAATLVAGLLVMDAIWFWSAVISVAARTPMPEDREAGDSLVYLAGFYEKEGIQKTWRITRLRDKHKTWFARGIVPMGCVFIASLVLLYLFA